MYIAYNGEIVCRFKSTLAQVLEIEASGQAQTFEESIGFCFVVQI